MRRAVAHRRSGRWRVLGQHEPAEKRPRVFSEGIFPIRRPEIVRRSDRFFCTIVEIVSEGRAHLALEFDRGDETAFVDDQGLVRYLDFPWPERLGERLAQCLGEGGT